MDIKYNCDICTFKSNQKNDCNRHMNSIKHKKNMVGCTDNIIVQPNDPKKHKCGYCNYKTTSSSNLDKHIDAKHDDNNDKYPPMYNTHIDKTILEEINKLHYRTEIFLRSRIIISRSKISKLEEFAQRNNNIDEIQEYETELKDALTEYRLNKPKLEKFINEYYLKIEDDII